jgi:hypothetical protein
LGGIFAANRANGREWPIDTLAAEQRLDRLVRLTVAAAISATLTQRGLSAATKNIEQVATATRRGER